MKKITILVIVLMGTVFYTTAQKVSGTIKDDQNKPVSGSTVSLKKQKDSSLVKLAASNASGKYEFNNVPAGNYFVSASHVSSVTKNSAAFEVSGSGETAVPEISLAKMSNNMKAVVVTAKKPMIEVKADKTILNVEGSINAVGQDALELLRKAPGVLLDKDDNISLSGKNGVQIYIDGKPTPLSGTDLTAYLKTMQSSQIESIEIITNPSAKYEAAGNAGIINIKLKKNKAFGTNGSVNLGYAVGVYPKYNGSVSLNHRNKKINIFSTYNYNRSKNENIFNLYRDLQDSIFDQRSKMTNRSEGHGFKAGLDYFASKRSTLGIMINGNFSDNGLGNSSRTNIYYKPNGVLDRILVADNNTQTKRNNANFNLNYRYADTAGRELNLDADYGLFRIKGDQFQPNYYFDASGAPMSNRIYNMISPTDIDIYSFKGDYEQNFKKGRLGFGGKISYVKSGNDFQRFDVFANGKVLDTLRSNDFNYKENINAVYVNYNRQFKGFMIQAGLRVENTNSEGTSNGFSKIPTTNIYVPYDSSFTRHYTDFFPSAAITFNKKPTLQWGLSYSRRIDRPAYQDLNPFEFKLDDYTFQKGNTQLRPQYTNSFSLTNTYKYKLTTSLTYSHVNDVFTQLVDTIELTRSFLTKKNLANQDIVSLNISYPFQYKWYSMFVNLNSYYSHYKANFGAGRTVDLEVYAYNIYMQHSAKLGKGFTAELSGFYNSPSIWGGTFKSKQMWAIDGGIQKSLWKNKANLKVSVSDIFHTLKFGGTSEFAGQYTRVSGNFESTQFKVNFTYRFGNNQVKAARQRKTAADDESKRVGSQGGGLNN